MEEEQKEVKHKKKKSLGLSARQSFKRQRAMAGMRADRAAFFEIIGLILVIGLVWFALSGGVNQAKFIEQCKSTAYSIGQKIDQFFNPDKFVVTDCGTYIKGTEPEGCSSIEKDPTVGGGSSSSSTSGETKTESSVESTDSGN